MKQLLGSLLAALVVLQGGIPQLPIDSAIQSFVALGIAAVVAALGFYLNSNAMTAKKNAPNTAGH